MWSGTLTEKHGYITYYYVVDNQIWFWGGGGLQPQQPTSTPQLPFPHTPGSATDQWVLSDLKKEDWVLYRHIYIYRERAVCCSLQNQLDFHMRLIFVFRRTVTTGTCYLLVAWEWLFSKCKIFKCMSIMQQQCMLYLQTDKVYSHSLSPTLRIKGGF